MNNYKSLKNTISRLFEYIGRHKFLFLLVAILVTISALANLLGTYMLKPIIDKYTTEQYFNQLPKVLMLDGIIYLLGALATLFYTQVMIRLAQKIVYETRRDCFNKLQKLPLSYFDKNTHGNIMSRFVNDIDTLSNALNNAFAMLISNLISIVGLVIILFILNWFLSIIVIICYTLMFIYILYASKKSKNAFVSQSVNTAELNGFIEEMISGQKVVKVFNHEEENMIKFNEKNDRLKNTSNIALKYSMSMVPMVVSISYINYALVAIIGGIIALGYLPFISFSLGGIASYLIFVRQAAMPINQLTNQANLLLNGLAGAERLFSLMDELEEVNDGKIILDNVNGDIEFKNVCFSYNENNPILTDLSLTAKSGKKIAFVGSTGAGKTTITNLINRFYEINSGKIIIDGIDIKDIDKNSLRKKLSIVLQDTNLFTGTIMDNIRYGRLEATDDEVINASKLANADNFIKKLPNGYNTVINSIGSNLSAGEKQLISIARAEVANSSILILDEATSSVDTRTERLVQDGLNMLMKGKTVFIIAHRLSTVINADVILVLENGKIIESGNHKELLAKKGFYYNLYVGKKEL